MTETVNKMTTMSLHKLMETFDYRIVGGGEDILTDLYGIDFESDHGTGYIVFNRDNLEVHQVQVCSKNENTIPYLWENSDFAKRMGRNKPDNNKDHLFKFNPVDDEETMIDIIEHIFYGLKHDGKSVIEITASKDEIYTWMMAAHEMDITLNRFVELAILNKMKEVETESEE